jgi:hypothetical protein
MKNSPPTRKTPSSRPSLLPPDGKSRVSSLLKNSFRRQTNEAVSFQQSAISFDKVENPFFLAES